MFCSSHSSDYLQFNSRELQTAQHFLLQRLPLLRKLDSDVLLEFNLRELQIMQLFSPQRFPLLRELESVADVLPQLTLCPTGFYPTCFRDDQMACDNLTHEALNHMNLCKTV